MRRIWQKTFGLCRYCGMPLLLDHYGPDGVQAAWELDYGVPLERGGTEAERNLWPVCLECKEHKGERTEAEYFSLRAKKRTGT